MPQTLECLTFIKQKKVPFIIAINKIDKNNADSDAILEDLLLNHDIEVEEIGGDVPVVYTSIKTGQGFPELLTALSKIRSEINLNTSEKAEFEGFIVETNQVPKLGPSATCFIQSGSLSIGQVIVCGTAVCKVKKAVLESGETLSKSRKLTPGTACVLTGWSDTPDLAFPLVEAKSTAEAKKIVESNKEKTKVLKASFKRDEQITQIIQQRKKHYLYQVLQNSFPKDWDKMSEDAQEKWIEEQSKNIKRQRSFRKKEVEIQMEVQDKLEELIENSLQEVFPMAIITDVVGTIGFF